MSMLPVVWTHWLGSVVLTVVGLPNASWARISLDGSVTLSSAAGS